MSHNDVQLDIAICRSWFRDYQLHTRNGYHGTAAEYRDRIIAYADDHASKHHDPDCKLCGWPQNTPGIQ